MNEPEAKTESLYRDWLYDQHDRFSKNDAFDELAPAIRKVIATADESALDGMAKSLFNKADKKLTDDGDKLIRKSRDHGMDPLDLERFDALVALGGGIRIKFGDMGRDEYDRADNLRYKNVRDAQNAYDEWRVTWAPYLPYLNKGMKVHEVTFEEPPDDGGDLA